MSRLSRAKKREDKRAERSAAPVTAPIDVRVPLAGTAGAGARAQAGSEAGGASIGGVPVVAAPGEEIQHAVLTHLQRIAVACGHPVLATVHDERIGYVVPLRVDADGSSRFTEEPVRMAPPGGPGNAVRPPAAPPALPAPPVPRPSDEEPYRDKPTHVLRSPADPVRDASPTYRLRAVPEAVQDAVPPGTAVPPTGEFGPPPAMDARPLPGDVPDVPEVPDVPDAPKPDQAPQPAPPPAPAHPAAKTAALFPPLDPASGHPEPEPDPKPTPPRGFDAVAEAILGDAPAEATPADASPLAEPTARISEAVKEGRIDAAAELAERAVGEASGSLGAEHPEVLRLRELAAYVAYLAGDPVRAFGLSLALARIHHRDRDAEAAYGNVQSAATAWRAVRDPAQGLDLGRELMGVWTGLTAEDGPAADDIEQLESARARMDRLATRAARSAEPPSS